MNYRLIDRAALIAIPFVALLLGWKIWKAAKEDLASLPKNKRQKRKLFYLSLVLGSILLTIILSLFDMSGLWRLFGYRPR